ncbi:hypothetical protein [Leisingera caerulea]|uniref:Uncharacterized protein n=1 Tax=Leisingera caerulea TaxID=506591 RepID=A0A9Q9HCT2_LEICA|nr:hypothetical protein [Leisingera caerulea]UWQ52338.1 hypothetical protein K3721_09765 [Leisingera caerulea]
MAKINRMGHFWLHPPSPSIFPSLRLYHVRSHHLGNFTASSTIGACVLVVAGSSCMLRTKKPKAPIVDVDAAERDASYHRLQNFGCHRQVSHHPNG